MSDSEYFPAFEGVIPQDVAFQQGGSYSPGLGSAPVGGLGSGGKTILTGSEDKLGKEPITDPNELTKAIQAALDKKKSAPVVKMDQIRMSGCTGLVNRMRTTG